MSLFRRLFYRKTPDRLLEITDRVYVFDCCFSSETMKEEEYTDYLDNILLQLQNYLPEAAFMVFNFRENEDKSLISDILYKYDIAVINYPQHYVGSPVLPIEVVHRFLSDCNNWLSMGGQKNVLLMHCERGGWPLLAFMLAGVLLYRKQYTEEKRTLELVCAQASKMLFHLYSPLDPRASHLRYLNYISRERVALDIPYNLTCLVLNTVPNFDGQGGCRPVVRVYGEDPFMPIDKTLKLLYTTSGTQEIVWYFREADISAVILDINCCVHGDVVLECIHVDENLVHEEIMFRVVFNTAFIQSHVLPLDHEQIDVLWNKKGQFTENFKAEVHFSDFDTASDPSTEPLIEDEDDHEAEVNHDDDDGDESGFGSAEEFFEAEEILSNPETEDGLSNHEAELEFSSSEIEAKSSFELNSSKYDNSNNIIGSGRQQLSTTTNTTLMSETLTEKVKLFDTNKLENDISGEKSNALVVEDHCNAPEETTLMKTESDYARNAISLSTFYAEMTVENTTISTVSGSLNSMSNTVSPPVPSPLPTHLYSTFSSKASPLPLSPPSVRPPPQPPPTPHVPQSPQLKLDDSAHKFVVHPTPPPHIPFGTSFLTKSSGVPPPPRFQGYVEVPPPPPMPSREQSGVSTPPSLAMCDKASPLPLSKAVVEIPPPPPPPPSSLSFTQPSIVNLPSSSSEVATSVKAPHPPLVKISASPPPPPPPPLLPSKGYTGASASSFVVCDGVLSPPPPPPPPSQRCVDVPSPPPAAKVLDVASSPVSLEVCDGTSPKLPPSTNVEGPPQPPSISINVKGPSPLPPAPPPPPPPGRSDVPPSPPPPPPLGRPGAVPSPPPDMPSVSPPPPPPPGRLCGAPPSPPPPERPSGGAPTPPPPPGRPSGGAPPPPPPPGGFCGAPPHPPPSGGFCGAPSPPSPPGRPGGGPSPPPPPGRPGGGPSPPPPMPGGRPGGPPPPPGAPGAPPPPGLSGGSSNARRAQSPSLGRSAANTQKAMLKPLHWVKVSRAMQGSLWAEFQKQTDKPSHPEFDVSELVSLFSVAVKKPASSKADEQSKSVSKSTKVTLIDLRRANNTAIMLTKIKMPLPDMMNATLALDESQLDGDQVENLIKFCPTKEEMELLKGYTGDKENLGTCEKFFLELMNVPRVESKLKSFLFKIQFRAQFTDLRKNLLIINSASEEIRNSDKLKEIMKRILFLGNTLNQGTARGSAVGFRLDSLLKLADIRATNNKMTLMHYLCKVLASKSPHLLQFHEDLSSLEAASKIQLKVLAEEQQTIVKGLEKVELELSASERDGPVSDVFRKNLKEFIDSAKAEGQSITALYSMAGKNADMVSVYFGEDPSKCPFEQVTATLLNFIRMFKKAHEENRKEAELEKKKAQKESEMEKSKEGGPSNKNTR